MNNEFFGKGDAIDYGPAWGYGYDSLLIDIDHWKESPFVKVESLGTSWQGRTIWHLTIEDTLGNQFRKNLALHNRTHPLEVQSWWVQEEMIEFLISQDSLAEKLRREYRWAMTPMLNPDGVELMEDCSFGFGRCNSQKMDLERDWNSFTPQPEVAALKSRYESVMTSNDPYELVLNMHSAFGCERYFWVHDSVGTSPEFLHQQQHFVEQVRKYEPDLISTWDSHVSWTNGTPEHFPESWFWLQFGEEVLALTYEDVKECPSQEENFYPQALALLKGIHDHLKAPLEERQEFIPTSTLIQKNYKSFRLVNGEIVAPSDGKLLIWNSTGKLIQFLEVQQDQVIELNSLPFGKYFWTFQGEDFFGAKPQTGF